MINPTREIRPEDFAVDPDRVWWNESDRIQAQREREELKRLYHIQEEAKAKARFKAEQARKDQIPYSEALATEICGRISEGSFLIKICEDPDMPTVRSCNQWLKQHSDFKALYDEAVNDRLNCFEDELVTIADDGADDLKVVTKGNKTTKVLDGEVISRAKLRVDVRKAHLKAYRPEKWGEQSTLITKSVDEVSELSTDEIEAKIAELDQKNETIRDPVKQPATKVA